MKANGLRPYPREAVEFVQQARRPGELIFMDTDEGAYYFQERMAGDAPAAAAYQPGQRPPAWIIYRDDWRGTVPPPQEWVKENTELRAVFGYDGIGRMARVYVRYRR